MEGRGEPGLLVPRGIRGLSRAWEDFGGSSLAGSKRRCLRERGAVLGGGLGPFCACRFLVAQGCWFIRTAAPDVLCWRCHTCADCARFLLALAAPGPRPTRAPWPPSGRDSARGSILSACNASASSHPSLLLLAVHRAPPRCGVGLGSASPRSRFASCSPLRGDARSACAGCWDCGRCWQHSRPLLLPLPPGGLNLS